MNRTFRLLIAFCLLALPAVSEMPPSLPVREAFNSPGRNAKPWTIWYWMHGCVSKEGVKVDLEAMKAVGLEGAYLMPIRGVRTPSVYEPAIEQLTPAWWAMVRYTMEEAARLDLKLGMHLSDGFALAGGPWITPELSMQQVVWTKTLVKGGRSGRFFLPQPTTREGYYKDIAVFAYPAPRDMMLPDDSTAMLLVEAQPLPIRVTSADGQQDLSAKTLTYRSDSATWIQYEYAQPFLCRSVVTRVNGTNLQSHRLRVEASHDGVHFRTVAQLEPPRHGWQNTGFDVTHAIPPTRARFFRFHWTPEGTLPGAEDYDNAKWSPRLRLTGLHLSAEPLIHQFEGKNASVWRLAHPVTEGAKSTANWVPQDQLINLTDKLQADGSLRWTPPKGQWVLLRMGHTSTGMTNATGGGGIGLECDKFNPVAVKTQFDQWFGKACELAGPDLLGSVLTRLHIDSWECGSQNWTAEFPALFAARRGYDLLPFLPVMAGVPLVSEEQSERILYDVRLTIAELVNEVFYGTLVEAAHAKGCLVTAESVAPTMMGDGLLHHGTVDLPMGEFWYESPTHDKPNDMLDAISGAHIYGKNLVVAEGFTQLRTTWEETPYTHKALLDRQFALGLNQLFFHVTVHNPFLDRKPGMTLDGIGLFFQRDQTWWGGAKAWVDYITRCQALLQLGHPVVDLAVFTGLEVPRRALLPDRVLPFLPGLAVTERVAKEAVRQANKGVPLAERPVGVRHAANLMDPADWVDVFRGYQYDSFNPDALFRLAKAENGRLVLPGGAAYSALIVPQPHALAPLETTPYTAQEASLVSTLRRLADEGVPVLAPPVLAERLGLTPTLPWKASDLSTLRITPDLLVSENGREAAGSLAWTHRAGEGFDLYFIANQQATDRRLSLSLRVNGRLPELYDPVDGRVVVVEEWGFEGDRTRVNVALAPYQSLFVVLERPVATNALPTSSATATYTTLPLSEPWTLHFDTAYGGPLEPVVLDKLSSWSVNTDPAIRYYSGTVSYTTNLNLSAVPPQGPCWLYLGRLADVAEVFVNGQSCGTAWTAPFRVEVSAALKPGVNDILIKVSNTWANRLEGDALLPEADRLTWTDGRYRKKTRDLLEAGLLGPASLEIPVTVKKSTQ